MAEELEFDIYIITLKSRQDRIDEFKSFYSNYINKINIIYGLTKNEIEENKKNITTNFCNSFCTTAMIGCASSHIKVWEKIKDYSNTDRISLILEDDTFISIKKLNKIINQIKELFLTYQNKIFIQLVGEGAILKSKTLITNKERELEFLTFYKHFFLGAYLITPDIASILVNYYQKNKIDYHIDLSLNNVFKENNIKTFILNNYNLGEQKGQTDSNMSDNKNKNIFIKENAPLFHYAMNFPIIKINNIIITFFLIFLILLFIIFIFFTNTPFLFSILGFIFYEIIKIN